MSDNNKNFAFHNLLSTFVAKFAFIHTNNYKLIQLEIIDVLIVFSSIKDKEHYFWLISTLFLVK